MNFDPERVESELAEIQRKSSPTEARTVILNLLVVSEEDSRPRAERALGAVLGKRAARVIHIVDTDGEESDISLSARCYLDYERKSVCFQEVLIENGSDGVGAAPGSWTPLLIRDIPVYVLWLSRFSEREPLLDHVQEQADKLIIDSEHAITAGDTAADVHRAVSGVMLPEGFSVSDFTWQRTRPLRRATAHLFDQEELADALFDLASVETEGAPLMFSALYQAWIAGRLGWQLEHAASAGPNPTPADSGKPTAGSEGRTGTVRRYTDRQGRRVQTGCINVGELESGFSVTMSFFSHKPIVLTVREDGCVEVAGGGGGEHVREIIRTPSDGEMLLSEIDAAGNENLYIDAFDLITP